MPLSQAQFNDIALQVARAAPPDLSEEEFKQLVFDTAQREEEKLPQGPGEIPTPPDPKLTLGERAVDFGKGAAAMSASNLRDSPPGMMVDAAIGAAKGAGSTAREVSDLVKKVPVVGPALQKMDDAADPWLEAHGVNTGPSAFTPTNTAQQVGKVIEQGAEYAAPIGAGERIGLKVAGAAPKLVRLGARMAGAAAGGGALAAAKGDDVGQAAVLSAAGAPIAEGAAMAGRAAVRAAPKLMQAGMKPGLSVLSKMSNASREGVQNMAKRLAQYAVDNKLVNPDQAEALIKQYEQQLDQIMQTKGGTVTDAPQRVDRYLKTLKQDVSGQTFPTGDENTVSQAIHSVADGPLGKDEIVTVMKPGKIIDPTTGRPIDVPTDVNTRVLRDDVPANEALDIARKTDKYGGTRDQWGRQSASRDTDAAKSASRAERDAVKHSVPETVPVLKAQQRAIQAKQVLDRTALREGNRDTVGLHDVVVGAGRMAAGGPGGNVAAPFIEGAIMHWVRNNYRNLGIYSDVVGKALQRGDMQTIVQVMSRLGVGATVDATANDAAAEPR